MIVIPLHKNDPLKNMTNWVTLAGIGKLLRQNPNQRVVRIYDLEATPITSFENVIFYRGHGDSALLAVENSSDYIFAEHSTDDNLNFRKLIVKGLNGKTDKIGRVFLGFCMSGESATLTTAPSSGSQSMMEAALNGLQDLGVEGLPVTAYRGYSTSNPNEENLFDFDIIKPTKRAQAAAIQKSLTDDLSWFNSSLSGVSLASHVKAYVDSFWLSHPGPYTPPNKSEEDCLKELAIGVSLMPAIQAFYKEFIQRLAHSTNDCLNTINPVETQYSKETVVFNDTIKQEIRNLDEPLIKLKKMYATKIAELKKLLKSSSSLVNPDDHPIIKELKATLNVLENEYYQLHSNYRDTIGHIKSNPSQISQVQSERIPIFQNQINNINLKMKLAVEDITTLESIFKQIQQIDSDFEAARLAYNTLPTNHKNHTAIVLEFTRLEKLHHDIHHYWQDALNWYQSAKKTYHDNTEALKSISKELKENLKDLETYQNLMNYRLKLIESRQANSNSEIFRCLREAKGFKEQADKSNDIANVSQRRENITKHLHEVKY